MYVDSDEDEKSFEGLCNKYYEPIYNYIFHRIIDKENTDDLTSSTFLKAMKFIIRKIPKIENFHAWIYKIATNEILMFKRGDKKRSKNISIEEYNIQISNFTDDTSENIDKNNEYAVLYKEMECLNEKEKTLIILHFFEKKTYHDISKILNIKENTLRPMMTRTLRKLKKNCLNKYEF